MRDVRQTDGAAEALKAALRRSLPLIVGIVLLGIVAVNVFKLVQGPRYEASARVLISTAPLSNIIAGTEPSFVDPQRVQGTALGIADSQRLYELAATRSGSLFGDADVLRSATEVTGDPNSDLISFTAGSSNPDQAIDRVNAVAEAYVIFRGRVSGAQIDRAIDGLRARLSALPAAGSDRAGLQADLDTLELLQSLNSSDAELVQPATSANKTSPSLLRDSLVGFSLGLVVALLSVALREAVDTTVRSEADVEELLSVPVLARVQPLPRRTRLVTYGRHKAMFADTYALLAAQLLGDMRGKQGVSLAVTSALAGEGKTATATNLAVAAARRGTNVLLADLDFRKPALSDVFGLPSDANGALQVMAGSASLDGTLWSVSVDGPGPRLSRYGAAPTEFASQESRDHREDPISVRARSARAGVGSLELLVSGGTPPTPEIPQETPLSSLLVELRERADLVILDTPPALLTVEMTELSRLVDMVLLVVRQGHVSRRNLRALHRQSQTWPAELAGAVMTDVQMEGRKHSYYYGRR